MTTPINTFQDILDAMERDPALRDALRRHILTDELLQMPARLDKVEADIEDMKAGQQRLEEGQNELKGRMNRVEIELTKVGGHVSHLMGTDYESTVARYADRLVRRHLRLISPAVMARAKGANATLPLPVGDQAAEEGRISWDEADDLALSDVIVAALTEEGEDVFVVAEISMTVQQKDRENVTRRADILQRATGTPTVPVTIGISQESPVKSPSPAFITYAPE